ncbi:hypothetical protein BJX61DRAFT_312881 [Aspergillus egyptiacus]|nr:hypothetical protein BJX61DRAFT_312881 [Aspergillus egyptiacus]
MACSLWSSDNSESHTDHTLTPKESWLYSKCLSARCPALPGFLQAWYLGSLVFPFPSAEDQNNEHSKPDRRLGLLSLAAPISGGVMMRYDQSTYIFLPTNTAYLWFVEGSPWLINIEHHCYPWCHFRTLSLRLPLIVRKRPLRSTRVQERHTLEQPERKPRIWVGSRSG